MENETERSYYEVAITLTGRQDKHNLRIPVGQHGLNDAKANDVAKALSELHEVETADLYVNGRHRYKMSRWVNGEWRMGE